MAGKRSEIEVSDSAVRLVLEFVNTRFDGKGGHVERFGNADDFTDWAREFGLLGDEMVSESEAAAARELRAALLTMLLVHSNHPDVTSEQVDEAEQQLVHAGRLYPVRIILSRNGSNIDGQNAGAAGVLGKVLAAANEAVQRGAWGRVKACCSEPCRHGFMDRTKNESQRYCGPKCASREAMRAMRERRAHA